MFGELFQSLDIKIDPIRCLTSKFLLMKIQFLEEKHRNSKLLQLRLKSACQMWVWAMAQTPKKWGFEPWLGNFSEPWLKVLFFGGLSHGSKSNNWCVRAMAQSPIIDEFEPWLKVQQFGCLSHGSKSNNWLVWAMAQSPIIWMFEPWLKGQ